MSLNCICGILTQATAALPIIKEQISSPWAIHLHMLQLPRIGLLFNTCITIPAFQEKAGSHGHPGQSAFITSNIIVNSSAGGSVIPSPTSASVLDNPCTENLGASFSSVYSPCSSGEYISPESSRLSESITGAQQL